MNNSQQRYKPFNGYFSGILLALVLLGSFLILGTGLGVFAAFSRILAKMAQMIAPDHAAAGPIWHEFGSDPLRHAIVFLLMGTAIGALLSAVFSRRISITLERGAACSAYWRVFLVFASGVFAGVASRIAGGGFFEMGINTSSIMLTGGFVFVLAVFLSGYSFAFFFRRQWHD